VQHVRNKLSHSSVLYLTNCHRFEKSLYDLIRGLRHQKGNEKEYIQASLRECRKEVKGQDISLKATALLKLTYLEMFGYDMTWAAFHVLEVMSSAQYVEKRVGYLAAIQSFRPDTDVLMLAENLLKKVIELNPIVGATLIHPGLNVVDAYHDFSSSCCYTSRHQSFHGKLTPIRSFTTAHTFARGNKKEDDCHIISTSSCVSRDPEARLAQDKRATT
jgi:hypothetical protein